MPNLVLFMSRLPMILSYECYVIFYNLILLRLLHFIGNSSRLSVDQIPHVTVQQPKPAGVTFIKADSSSDGSESLVMLQRPSTSTV